MCALVWYIIYLEIKSLHWQIYSSSCALSTFFLFVECARSTHPNKHTRTVCVTKCRHSWRKHFSHFSLFIQQTHQLKYRKIEKRYSHKNNPETDLLSDAFILELMRFEKSINLFFVVEKNKEKMQERVKESAQFTWVGNWAAAALPPLSSSQHQQHWINRINCNLMGFDEI